MRNTISLVLAAAVLCVSMTAHAISPKEAAMMKAKQLELLKAKQYALWKAKQEALLKAKRVSTTTNRR